MDTLQNRFNINPKLLACKPSPFSSDFSQPPIEQRDTRRHARASIARRLPKTTPLRTTDISARRALRRGGIGNRRAAGN
jgi:hypothetical protein